jgi:hypothetical protein
MPPETASALATLSWVARALAVQCKTGRYDEAVAYLDANRLPGQIARVAKAALGAGTIASSSLGTPFEGIMIGPFSDAMRTASAFYRILSDNGFTRIPMQRRVGMVTSAPTAGTVAEGSAIPLSRIVIGNVVLSPIKAAGLIALTDELLFATDPGGQAMFSRQLQAVLSAAVDTGFANAVTTGITATTSTGPTKDVRALLSAVDTAGVGSIAKLYFIGGTNVGKLGSTLATYFPAFTAVSATGGELANLPLVISSGLPVDELLLVDGSGIAADADAPEVSVSSEADLQMDSAPTGSSATPTSSSVVSMYATNSIAVRATAIFGAARLRADAVAVVNSISSTTWAA